MCSTNHIQQYWRGLKAILKKIYNIIAGHNIIYYIKEVQTFFNKVEEKDKEQLIFKLFKEVYVICKFNYPSENDIKSLNNYESKFISNFNLNLYIIPIILIIILN